MCKRRIIICLFAFGLIIQHKCGLRQSNEFYFNCKNEVIEVIIFFTRSINDFIIAFSYYRFELRIHTNTKITPLRMFYLINQKEAKFFPGSLNSFELHTRNDKRIRICKDISGACMFCEVYYSALPSEFLSCLSKEWISRKFTCIV